MDHINSVDVAAPILGNLVINLHKDSSQSNKVFTEVTFPKTDNIDPAMHLLPVARIHVSFWEGSVPLINLEYGMVTSISN